MSAEHFARIRPIVGNSLASMRITVLGVAQAAALIEYLAASGLAQWIWQYHACEPIDHRMIMQLEQRILDRHGAALGLNVQHIIEPHEVPLSSDLILACGDPTQLCLAVTIAEQRELPALLCVQLGTQTRAMVVLPGDDIRQAHDWINQLAVVSAIIPEACYTSNSASNVESDWNTICTAPLLAGIARAILLRATPFARSDIAQLWTQGRRIVQIAGQHPFDLEWLATQPKLPSASDHFHTPYTRRGALLIVGLGSIGSVAAALLAPYATQLILIDPDRVDAVNPARQHYTLADIGNAKALALATTLAADCPITTPLLAKLEQEEQIDALIATHQIAAALIATGTQTDFAIARALRRHGIPHVVARCYPRARYWEAIIIDGKCGPAFEAIRGHVQVGPSATPTPEQIAAYSESGVLDAEPATLIESGWAAAWAARLVHQLATPHGLRERWMLELLAAEHTCLIGGAWVDQTANGPAYAIDLPGRIWAWGRASVGAQSAKRRA